MKTNLKRVSKRSLALILGILMLFSTLMVGSISVNADTTTYYLWYGAGNGDISKWTTHLTMISDGSSNYYADLDFESSTNYYFTVNTNATRAYGDLTNSITATVADGTSCNNIGTQKWNVDNTTTYQYPFTSRITSSTVKIRFTYNPTSKQITLSNSDGSNPGGSTGDGETVDSGFYLIGNFTSDNWSSNTTSNPINRSYGIDNYFYKEVSIPSNYNAGDSIYFALYNGSNRYAPETQNTNIPLSMNDAVYGDYSHSDNSWKYVLGSNVTAVRICIDRATPEDSWYPRVWIEEITSSGLKQVTDQNLISVLKKEKVMIYGGEKTGWNQSEFHLMKSNSLGDKETSGTMSGSYTIANAECEFAVLTAPIGDYYMGHWASNMHTTIEAGGAYIVRETESETSQLIEKSSSGTNCLYKINNGATTTATTTISSQITEGEMLPVNTSTAKGISSIGKDNQFKYYLFDGTNYYEAYLSDGKVDTSSFPAGIGYKLLTVLYDGGIYVVADTDTFEIKTVSLPEYTITYSAGANGSINCKKGDTTVDSGTTLVENTEVTFTIAPNEGYEVDTFTVNGEDKKSSITNNTYTHTVQADVDVQVTFKKTTYTISVDSSITGGTISPSATSASMGDIITFTSTPEKAFFQKSVTVRKASGETVTCTNNSFTMPAENVTISAEFITYKITGSLITAGTSLEINGDGDPNGRTWDNFNRGIAFDTKVSDTIYSKTINLTSTDLTELRNKFRLKSNDGVVYRPNDSDATDDDGKGNKGYLITNSDSENNSYATINGESSNFFYFDTAGEYTIFIEYVAGGNPKIWAVRGAFNLTSTTTKCTVKFYSDADLTTEITKSKANQTVYVQVTPDENCEIKTVTANNSVTLTPVSGKENVYSFTMPSKDVNVTATAETIKQTVTFTFYNSSLSVNYLYNGTAYNGVDVSSGDTITVDKGTTLSISAVLNSGYEPATDKWKIEPTPTPDATTTDTTCSFTVSDNTSVIYNTKKIDYSITYVYNPTQGGTSVVKVDDAEVTKLNIGNKFTVDQAVNTSDGYEIDSVEVKAGSTILYPDAVGIYTMQTGDVTVTTTYKAIKPTISNCPAETVVMYAGASYTIPATTDYGTLSYSEPTGDFTFSGAVATAPNKEGNYTITVTATNKPEGITAAATTTATINITVKFTDTQKAYKDLEAKFAQIGYENSDYYENNEAWTAYENAVSAANSLLATFPLPTATNTDDYVNAKTTLQSAYDEIQKYKKVNTIYVLSKYAPGASNPGYVNIHMFNKTTGESYEPVDNSGYFATTDDNKGKSYHMTNLGTVKVGSENKGLYKFEFFGKADFLIFVGAEQSTVISDSNKLTGDIETCKGFTSYYIDIKDVSASNSPSKTTYDKSPYAPLSVTLTKTSDTCVEDAVYDLTTNIPKTEGGTLKTTSGVTVNHTYSYTLNGDTYEIATPATWVPADPGVYTITVKSSNGIEAEDVENTFTLYVQDKLDKPILAINGKTDSNTVTVNNETDVVLSAISSGADYPEGVKYIFTVDGTEYESNVPTYTFAVGTESALALGNHTVSVKVIAPDTKYVGTEINQYVDSEASDEKTVKIDTVKYTYTFDFTKCHVATNEVTFKLEEKDTTVTDLKGSVEVDKNSPVTFTVTMSGKYRPIPNDNCWSGVADATIGADKLSYSFTASNSNAGSTVVFRSYLPVEITPDTQVIDIASSAKIDIKELDSNANYQLLYKKTTDTKFIAATATLTDKEFTTSNLPYGKYQFKVRQYTDYYSVESNVVNVNAIIGKIELKYYYRDYKSENGISYDPYIGKENNLSDTATEYSVVLKDDVSSVVEENDYATLYEKYAPNLSNNYFNYTLVTTGVTGTLSEDNAICTITGPLMTPTEKIYTVSINGVKGNDFTSYYQQKTFLLDASKYCTEGTCGYVWYYVDSEGKETVVSTSQYYKLRVAKNTDLRVKGSDVEITTPSTTINEPVYTEIISNNAVKVQMSMLVENYLPEDAVRTRTGVVYYSYEGDIAPAVDSSKLPSIIANSATLANGDPGKTYTVGTESGIDIKGYYTNNDNVNGKFIFAPIASISSTKTYVVYSYLTYIQDNVSVTIISSPVTASVALYKQQNTTS